MKKLTRIWRTIQSVIVVGCASIFFVIIYYLNKLWNLIKKLWKTKEK